MSFFDHLFRLGYSRDLHQQLKGLSADCTGYSGDAIYQVTGIVMIAVSLLIMLNYYYGIFNNPRFTHRRVWFINIVAACSIVGAFAYFNVVSFLPAEKHCADIHFTILDCTLFAFTEVIYTAVTCIIFSLLFKWKSVSNKKVPF
jgi:multisubunit Na+/H+ antiporter MnhB subunit